MLKMRISEICKIGRPDFFQMTTLIKKNPDSLDSAMKTSKIELNQSASSDLDNITQSRFLLAKYRIQVVDPEKVQDLPLKISEDLIDNFTDHYHSGPEALGNFQFSPNFPKSKSRTFFFLVKTKCLIYDQTLI